MQTIRTKKIKINPHTNPIEYTNWNLRRDRYLPSHIRSEADRRPVNPSTGERSPLTGRRKSAENLVSGGRCNFDAAWDLRSGDCFSCQPGGFWIADCASSNSSRWIRLWISDFLSTVSKMNNLEKCLGLTRPMIFWAWANSSSVLGSLP